MRQQLFHQYSLRLIYLLLLRLFVLEISELSHDLKALALREEGHLFEGGPQNFRKCLDVREVGQYVVEASVQDILKYLLIASQTQSPQEKPQRHVPLHVLHPAQNLWLAFLNSQEELELDRHCPHSRRL